MRDPGKILFRCRLCGEVYNPCHVPDWHTAISYAATGREQDHELYQRPQTPELFHIHFCDDGRRGLADLVGAQPD